MPLIPQTVESIEDVFAGRIEGLDATAYQQGSSTAADVKLRRSRRPFAFVSGSQQGHLEFVCDVSSSENTDRNRDHYDAVMLSTLEIVVAYKVRNDGDSALEDKRLAQRLARRIGAVVNEHDARFDSHIVTAYRAAWAPAGEYLLVTVIVDVSHDYDLTPS